ncbi:DUF262 domain-containing protein [Coleofasciculus sp. FACHB-SPT36]|uniref:GmrSD restriction endonuclease domain-containing protein n=1 Tax=Cyanophyceae TaxID=3028117 RepID=UPI00168BEE9A|nr:DUF262 domain-containing protein [Coleofasciculus sp. FACHB-SPT36]MBD2540983.1 DUF262 domain-containing protein [Coleofasciculus sp. FACHB-SPT36]
MNNNVRNIHQEIANEEIEGLEILESVGWGEYPLDSVFVRTEQRTVGDVVKRIKANRYILDPDFQRDFVWSTKQQSRLIESCLMRIPLPVFYVAEADDGRIIVVDGLQRLTTFVRYLNNEFFLSRLGDGGEETAQGNFLTGKRFEDLPLNLQERVEDTQLTLYILDAKAPQRAKLDIFERVNSGEPLARQQMRNCLFNGPATRWLADASESKEFFDATGGSLNKRTMRDREAINRFCAFRLLGVEQYKGDMDDFLAKSLGKMNSFSQDQLEELNRVFQKSMWANHLLFGKHAFRKSLLYQDSSASRSVINIALFDVCSVWFAKLDKVVIEKKMEVLIKAIKELINNAEFSQAITISTNGLRQVKLRFEMISNAIKKVV